MTTQTRNEVLEGIALEAPALSHENHGTRFYRFPLQVPWLSGTRTRRRCWCRRPC